MSYAFPIDPTMTLLEATLQAAMGGYAPTETLENDVPEVEIPVGECELDETWQEFSKILDKFKLMYKRALLDYKSEKQTVEAINKKTYIAKLISERVEDDVLRMKLLSVIESDEMDAHLAEHIAKCAEKKALVGKMEKILEDTHAEEYARFMCPICTENSVDLFMDPCGHVICEACMTKMNPRDRGKCAVCRTLLRNHRKIYTV